MCAMLRNFDFLRRIVGMILEQNQKTFQQLQTRIFGKIKFWVQLPQAYVCSVMHAYWPQVSMPCAILIVHTWASYRPFEVGMSVGMANYTAAIFEYMCEPLWAISMESVFVAHCEPERVERLKWLVW